MTERSLKPERGALRSASMLVARAKLWRMVARAFWYPDDRLLTLLFASESRRELDYAASMADETGRLSLSLANVWEAADGVAGQAERLCEEHMFLFTRQVLASPHELAHTLNPLTEIAPHLSEIGGFYAAFGFQASIARPERPDHISLECDFIAALSAKEAYALAQGWLPQAGLTNEARLRFLREHAAGWFATFAARLDQHSRFPFFSKVMALAVDLLALEGVESRFAERPALGSAPIESVALVTASNESSPGFEDC